MADQLLTPSKISAWLECAHALTLHHEVAQGLRQRPEGRFGPFARLIADKGLAHEAACTEHFSSRPGTSGDAALLGHLSQTGSLLEVPPRAPRETFDQWVDRIGDPLSGPDAVLYQLPLVHAGVRGIADFVVRISDGDGHRWEPVDAKLVRSTAKPAHLLQLCFYAEALEALTGSPPRQVHLWLGSGRIESYRAADFMPYWRRMRRRIARLLDAPPPDTRAVKCGFCEFCEFAGVCDDEWRAADSLQLVAGLQRRDLAALEEAGITTMAALASLAGSDHGDEPLGRLAAQARLQVAARTHHGHAPPFRRIPAGADPTWGRGLQLLPAPDDADVFLDFEGHPFWRADTGLFFLFGLLTQNGDGTWRYQARWAHDLDEEKAMTAWLIEFLATRRAEHVGMHVYHYNHTERSSLERLAAVHGVHEVTLEALVETGAFVDLLPIVRNTVQIGIESYSLKDVERVTGFERRHGIEAGAGAVLEYEHYVAERDPDALVQIAAYNEDDVRSTLALRDWLVTLRTSDALWRTATFDLAEQTSARYEQIELLHHHPIDTPEHLLGDLLGYWHREWLAHIAPLWAKVLQPPAHLLDDPDAITGLVCEGLRARTGANGKELLPAMRFSFPTQDTSAVSEGQQVVWRLAGGPPMSASICTLAPDEGVLELVWNERNRAVGDLPVTVTPSDWVSAGAKEAALLALADDILEHQPAPNPAAMALLRRDLPRFSQDGGPPGGLFSDDLDEMRTWIRHLDSTCVAVQGPPGTGKTFRGAHLVHSLITNCQRVGITALSHAAIANLVAEVHRLFEVEGDLHMLKAVVKKGQGDLPQLPGVRYVSSNARCADESFNLVAGTTWLFASNDMAASPVDVLIIDEAGQLALADAVAASRSASSIVLLGDPLQLSQVSQATHPGGGGRSVLEHILGDDITIPADRGVFLHETRRMHPSICGFLSEEIYESRLVSHPDCARQMTAEGTGLRWLRATHQGCVTESREEAQLIAEKIRSLIGTPWTDSAGTERPLTVDDVMVVAPYNAQVTMLRTILDSDPVTAGTPVGTVDRFQGQQAAIVFFSMTASSAEEVSRGMDFLFSRHRLNVAMSRARCLAYLVCTDDLLDSRARTVGDMRLISTLCAFVETAEQPRAERRLR